MLLLQFLKIFHLLRFQEFVNAAEMFADATMTELINLADKTIEKITVVHARYLADNAPEEVLGNLYYSEKDPSHIGRYGDDSLFVE